MKVNFDKAYLYDSYGYISHIFTRTDGYFSGKLESVISWDSNKTPCETLFVGEVYIKFDGCSHWNFLGEDYIKNDDNSIDGYYHLCGIRCYLEFIKGLLFVFKLATETIDKFLPSEIERYKEYEHLLQNCKIEIIQN